jgi:hypothetical protein
MSAEHARGEAGEHRARRRQAVQGPRAHPDYGSGELSPLRGLARHRLGVRSGAGGNPRPGVQNCRSVLGDQRPQRAGGLRQLGRFSRDHEAHKRRPERPCGSRALLRRRTRRPRGARRAARRQRREPSPPSRDGWSACARARTRGHQRRQDSWSADEESDSRESGPVAAESRWRKRDARHRQNPKEEVDQAKKANQLTDPTMNCFVRRRRIRSGLINPLHVVRRERAQRSEPRDRSAPAQRRARARVGESEGRSPADKISVALRTS